MRKEDIEAKELELVRSCPAAVPVEIRPIKVELTGACLRTCLDCVSPLLLSVYPSDFRLARVYNLFVNIITIHWSWMVISDGVPDPLSDIDHYVVN